MGTHWLSELHQCFILRGGISGLDEQPACGCGGQVGSNGGRFLAQPQMRLPIRGVPLQGSNGSLGETEWQSREG